MKSRYAKIFPIALSAAMLFAGCAAQTAASGRNAAEAAVSQTASEGSADSAKSLTALSVSFDESFSKRDLSGDYDISEAVAITLSGDGAACGSDAVSIDGSTVRITGEGTYVLSGTFCGTVIVDASDEDKIQLVLSNAEIYSDSFAAIYVKNADKVFVTLDDGTLNKLSNGGEFTQLDDNDVDAVIYSKDDLTLNGTGTLIISSPAGSGIESRDELTVTNGVYEIEAGKHALKGRDCIAVADGTFALAALEDGLHCENSDDDTLGSIYVASGKFIINASDDGIHATSQLTVDGGDFNISAAEGMEATYIVINDGNIVISASDDGINAARKSSAFTPTFELNGGEVTITMGAGDTDGVDSNGNIVINGGTISVNGQSTFDYDGTAQYNGGTIIVNGEKTDTIPNQTFGGHGGTGFGGMDGSHNTEPFGGANGEHGGGQMGGRDQHGQPPAGQPPMGEQPEGQLPDDLPQQP